ncbi:ATP-binding protein [Frankia sp. AgB1.9]|uniref:type IV secretory system conjugative DNA transfer family protein n=1 Tax=unclassified Frankia TaxID=2632575 RepID=UPI0019337F7C|nr:MULTISPECIES: ATP-binding protein [unclassified Frankia]MBL7487181.1 ATP-binding protein [Frankia sp. AgW1.1]MBL7547926.1 ATP-binding protein [Frankia sp. AgB1.9]MBL7623950.1 ATP-binding protein [Frankia sp. AgB1.8]
MSRYYMQSALVLVGCGLVFLAAVPAMRSNQRNHYHRSRRVYEASFPADLTHDRVLAFIRSLHGMPRPGVLGRPHAVVFEVYADARGIKHLVSFPDHVQADVEGLFRTHLGGTLVKLGDDPAAGRWDRAVEVGLTNEVAALRLAPPEAAARTILSQLSSLASQDALILQWVLYPGRHRASDQPESKEKLAEPNFRAVSRLASRGPNADRLMHRLRSGLKAMERYGVSFRQQAASASAVRRRLAQRSGVVAGWSGYSAPELAVLLAFPFGSPDVPGLPSGRARRLAPAVSIPRAGLVLARSNYPGMEDRLIAMPPQALMTHCHVIGGTGVGKSAFLHNLAIHMMKEGHGVILIEPKADLARDVLRSVPEHRAADVVWFDPTDTAYPIGFNVLAGPNPEQTAAHVVSLFKALYADSWGARLAQILRYAVLTSAVNGLTLYDTKQLLTNPAYRSRVVDATTDLDIRQFWRRMEDIGDFAFDSVINKLDGFLGSRAIRNMVGQRDGLDIGRAVRERKIILVPLPEHELGEANGSMLGSLLVDKIWREIRLRPHAQRYPVALILDEMQHYLSLATSLDDMLAEARSYQLGLVGAHQHLGQLPEKTAKAFRANARTKVAFRIDPEDGAKLERAFKPLKGTDLDSLGRFEVALSLMTESGNAPTATGLTLPPPEATRSGEAIVEASRARYGRPVEEVEAEFRERYRSGTGDGPRPRMGRA